MDASLFDPHRQTAMGDPGCWEETWTGVFAQIHVPPFAQGDRLRLRLDTKKERGGVTSKAALAGFENANEVASKL